MKDFNKICFKCSNELPIIEFYKHAKTKDGYLNKCKLCTKKDTKKREAELRKDKNWIEKEKERGRKKYHRLGYKNKYKPTKDRKKEIIRKYNIWV